MKRKSLFNRIISLSIIAMLYLSMSASAYAELDIDTPATNQEETADTKAADSEQDVAETPSTEVDSAASEETKVQEKVDDGQNLPPEEEITAEGEKASEGEKDGEKKNEEPPKLDDEAENPENSEKTEAVDEENKEPEVGDTYYIIVTNEDGSSVKTIYEYVLNEETGELEAVVKEEILGEFDEDGNLIEKEEACEHELFYKSNNDGTHTIKCINCDMETYIESCEYDEDGICIHCKYHRLPDPVLTYEDEDVKVTIKGAIPENADLKVTPIRKDNDDTKEEYEKVESTLNAKSDEDDYFIKGFLAYDICFIDIETKEEVEPTGEVTVSLEYKEEKLPDNPIESSGDAKQDILVQHFNEKTNEVEELVEAGKAEVTANDSKAITSAEFTSDTFSTYVITWVENTSRTVKINLVNKLDGGNELVPGSNTRTLNPPTTSTEIQHTIEEFVNENPIEGYTFVKAVYNDTEVGKVGLSYSSDNYTVTIYGKNGNRIKQISTSKYYPNINLDIDLLYRADKKITVTNIATGIAAADTTTTYEYQIFKPDGSPLANKAYTSNKDSSTNLKTDNEGKVIIAPGETIEIKDLEDGNYKVVETAVTGKYSFNNFITKVIVAGEQKEEYEAASNAERKVEVELSAENIPSIKFKNCYAQTIVTPIREANKYKFITYKGDDTYELGFRFNGPEEKIETTVNEQESYDVNQKKYVDIVLIIDKSNSMEGDNITYVKNAVKSMVGVFEEKDDVDAKWKVVDFGDHATLVSGRWINTEDVNSAVTSTLRGGTNYQAGFELGQEEITSGGRNNAEKIIIFLTDGHPTYHYEDGKLAGRGSATSVATYDATLEAAKVINCSQFYIVGMGLKTLNVTEPYSYWNGWWQESGWRTKFSEDPVVFLNKIAANATASKKQVTNVAANKVGELFAGLAGTITSETTGSVVTKTRYEYATNAEMVDQLSEYAQIKPGSEFRISVSDGSSDEPENEPRVSGHIGEDGVMTEPAYYYLSEDKSVFLKAEYDAATKTMKLIFPDGYELNQGLSYQVKMYVEPTDKAYEEYMATGYPEGVVGDDGTDNFFGGEGTSAGKPGFYSNDLENAKATFTYKGADETLKLPKPVIQVHLENTWELYKTDENGKAGARLDGAQFLLKDSAEGSEVAYMGTSKTDQNGLVVWSLEEGQTIPVDKTYTLTEVQAPVGYARSTDYWQIAVDGDNKPTVTAVTDNEQQGEYEMEVLRVRNKVTYKLYFKNFKTAYELPETGGNGIYRTTVLGVALMLSSVYLFYINRKRKNINC